MAKRTVTTLPFDIFLFLAYRDGKRVGGHVTLASNIGEATLFVADWYRQYPGCRYSIFWPLTTAEADALLQAGSGG